jgi:ubiquinone/menaquinone biosynthesis C-methylase UbiE
MFNNWINFHEIFYLIQKYQRDPATISKLISWLSLSQSNKIKAAWEHTQNPPKNWWDVPAIRERWNYLISGDSQVDYCDYISQKYWAGRESMHALSLACGSGTRELRWAKTNKFNRIDAYDLSENRIRYTADVAIEKGLNNIINYQVSDVFKLDVQENFYDVIFGEGSLHHFSPLETILQRVHQSLKPDGYFIVNDFVGPTRFQWTSRQLEITNSLLAILPSRYKTLWNSNFIKQDILRPGKLAMVLKDPSEAVESSMIRPLLNDIFDVVEIKGYGGAILHPLLSGIAHHFLSSDDEGQRFLDVLFEMEDLLLASGDIQDDYIVAVCKKRSTN